MDALGHRAAPWLLAVVLLAALLAGQAASDALLTRSQHEGTGQLVGRTGFAYLTGIRTAAAAALWARLDPLNDDYYNDLPLGQKKFLLPSIRLATWLDPNLAEPFYVGPFVLYEAGLKRNALDLAAEGVAHNPDSALLHASYAQLLLVEGLLPQARREADIVLTRPWLNESDEYQLLPPLEIIFRKTGSPDLAKRMAAEHQRLKLKFEAAGAMP
jgi:hypothetical protein